MSFTWQGVGSERPDDAAEPTPPRDAAASALDVDASALDVDAVLRRIGITHPPAPSAEALALLQRAWVGAIPFENLDVVLGRPIRLGLPAIEDKLVHRGRGGYCLEHVPLFVALLRALGWEAHQALASMTGLETQHAPPTHATAIVRLGGEQWMADVGFGGGPLLPLPLRDGAEVGGDGTWAHRLVRRGDRWQQQTWRKGGWTPTHATTAEPATAPAIAEANRWVSTDPASLFVGRAVLMRVTEHERTVLVDRELRVARPGTAEETRRTLDPDERITEIVEGFGVALDDDERAALR
ncbi:arylamine N-acetyltransferase [Patulibacter brassicae]|uniref:Arylamine N-acetyltransferase n=1 Tax=Patulibacter brassicae TaxID=1705717 RepID=A0ABU4VP18_9ACTN|nr:arylamine N-acetyltransferase [Patulibacter brassicae]MDX8153180.1 arylamine N-acetyltransferase [Patulibacter brassicae]